MVTSQDLVLIPDLINDQIDNESPIDNDTFDEAAATNSINNDLPKGSRGLPRSPAALRNSGKVNRLIESSELKHSNLHSPAGVGGRLVAESRACWAFRTLPSSRVAYPLSVSHVDAEDQVLGSARLSDDERHCTFDCSRDSSSSSSSTSNTNIIIACSPCAPLAIGASLGLPKGPWGPMGELMAIDCLRWSRASACAFQSCLSCLGCLSFPAPFPFLPKSCSFKSWWSVSSFLSISSVSSFLSIPSVSFSFLRPSLSCTHLFPFRPPPSLLVSPSSFPSSSLSLSAVKKCARFVVSASQSSIQIRSIHSINHTVIQTPCGQRLVDSSVDDDEYAGCNVSMYHNVSGDIIVIININAGGAFTGVGAHRDPRPRRVERWTLQGSNGGRTNGADSQGANVPASLVLLVPKAARAGHVPQMESAHVRLLEFPHGYYPRSGRHWDEVRWRGHVPCESRGLPPQRLPYFASVKSCPGAPVGVAGRPGLPAKHPVQLEEASYKYAGAVALEQQALHWVSVISIDGRLYVYSNDSSNSVGDDGAAAVVLFYCSVCIIDLAIPSLHPSPVPSLSPSFPLSFPALCGPLPSDPSLFPFRSLVRLAHSWLSGSLMRPFPFCHLVSVSLVSFVFSICFPCLFCFVSVLSHVSVRAVRFSACSSSYFRLVNAVGSPWFISSLAPPPPFSPLFPFVFPPSCASSRLLPVIWRVRSACFEWTSEYPGSQELSDGRPGSRLRLSLSPSRLS